MIYPYYFYGSSDSIDSDVLISIPKCDMPIVQEDRKRFLKKVEIENGLSKCNTNLIVVENGIIVDTIYPKSWIDGLNNSLYFTYTNHLDKQKFPNPIVRIVKRNKLLAIYKTVRTVLSLLSRTEYGSIVKPALNSSDMTLKISALYMIDFTMISDFGQKNMKNVDIWKTIAFYIGQNISLIKNDIEIYTKKDLILYYPELEAFISRKEGNRNILNKILSEYLDIIDKFEYEDDNNFLISGNETIDYKNEKF